MVTDRKNVICCKSEENGTAHAAFVWWDLAMDSDGEFMLSCAPKWYLDRQDAPWRDHWIQGVYYFANELKLKTDEEVHLIGHHDELSFWFDTNKSRFIIVFSKLIDGVKFNINIFYFLVCL